METPRRGGPEAGNIGREPCYGCPVGCSQLKLARSGPYAGILAEGPEFETFYSLGTETGVSNMDAVIAADRLCDELGLDTMSAGVAVGFAMELVREGPPDQRGHRRPGSHVSATTRP